MQLPLNKKHRHRDDACSTSAAAYASSNEWRWCFQVLADTWDRRAGRGWSSGSYRIIRPSIDRLTPPLKHKKKNDPILKTAPFPKKPKLPSRGFDTKMTNGLKSVSRDTYSFFNNHKKQSSSANCPLQRAGGCRCLTISFGTKHESISNKRAFTIGGHFFAQLNQHPSPT